jgi:hypothetical protein
MLCPEFVARAVRDWIVIEHWPRHCTMKCTHASLGDRQPDPEGVSWPPLPSVTAFPATKATDARPVMHHD